MKKVGYEVHRIVAFAFISNEEESYDCKHLVVNHKDNNSMNNCVDNLEYLP